jgi:phosphoglycolate phosphatase-like HAD superfamily hydrolase
MTLQRLILFDIDGTLLWTGGAGRAAIKIALEQVYGTAGSMDAQDPGGRTIKEIVASALAGADIPPEVVRRKYEQFSTTMIGTLEHLLESGTYQVEPCPGGRELVAALAAREDALVGLLTGNPRRTAEIKLNAAGYDLGVFRVGAYGSESEDRSVLLQLVMERVKAITDQRFAGAAVVVIGDTTLDVMTGQSAGARTLAVTTGGDDRATLEAAHPDVIFDNLTDTQAVLAAIFAPA